MFRFLHIADVHLDTAFYSQKPWIRDRLREGLRNSFKKAVDFSLENKLDAILIAGDFFDSDKLSFKTEQSLLKELNRLKENGVKVFYATGNHDPGSAERVSSIKWPDNVRVFRDDRVETVEICGREGIIVKISSCGHKIPREGRNLIKNFPMKEGNMPHIGLVHCMVAGSKDEGEHERYLPCSLADLKERGYDYWALGHIHKGQEISSNVFYSGNLQGRNPRETGKKGGLYVTIDDYLNVRAEFKEFADIQWHTAKLGNLEDIRDYNELKNSILKGLEEYMIRNDITPKDTIMRVELEGRAFLKKELEVEENLNQLIEDLLLDVNLLDMEIRIDGLTVPINEREFRDGEHVLAYALKYLDEIKEGKDSVIMEKLMALPLLNFKGNEGKDKKTYIRKLAEELEELAITYMAGEDR